MSEDFDWTAFGWGMLVGSFVTVVAEGVILYFAWPYVLGALKTWVGAEALKEVLK